MPKMFMGLPLGMNCRSYQHTSYLLPAPNSPDNAGKRRDIFKALAEKLTLPHNVSPLFADNVQCLAVRLACFDEEILTQDLERATELNSLLFERAPQPR